MLPTHPSALAETQHANHQSCAHQSAVKHTHHEWLPKNILEIEAPCAGSPDVMMAKELAKHCYIKLLKRLHANLQPDRQEALPGLPVTGQVFVKHLNLHIAHVNRIRCGVIMRNYMLLLRLWLMSRLGLRHRWWQRSSTRSSNSDGQAPFLPHPVRIL